MLTPSQIVKAIKANLIEIYKSDPKGDPVYHAVCLKGGKDISPCFFSDFDCRVCPLGEQGSTKNLDILISALEKIE